MAWFQTFPSKSKRRNQSDEIKFQNASKRQIEMTYFYITKTPPYKIIAGDSQTHIISNLGLGRRLLFVLEWNLLFCLELSLSSSKARHMRAVLPCIDVALNQT